MKNDYKKQEDLTNLISKLVEIAYEVRLQGFEKEYRGLDRVIKDISYKTFDLYQKSA